MKRLLVVLSLAILATSCSSTPAPAPTSVPSTQAPAQPAVPAAPPTPAAAIPQAALAPESLAESYVRALFAKDTVTMAKLFPASKPDADREEYGAELQSWKVDSVSGGEVKATAQALVAGKRSIYHFQIGTAVVGGQRVINMAGRSKELTK